MTYDVRYWTGSTSNRWESFCVYGTSAKSKAYEIAGKLTELFAAVEMHITDDKNELVIERIHS